MWCALPLVLVFCSMLGWSPALAQTAIYPRPGNVLLNDLDNISDDLRTPD